ncbi:MAG: tRNA (guanosine(46)-N7)-methyltransferase TrmB [Calditerrivibrio sp.]|nr:tRNA (guanosine(46)-N7)-methyltransferase TrmB [Calditerrivibrio sp.]
MEKDIVNLELPFEEGLYIFSDVIKSQIKPLAQYKWDNVFSDRYLNVEIGIGNGEFICHMAEVNRDEVYIGFEVIRKIFRKAIARVKRKCLDNVRLIQFDAGFFIPLLRDCSVKNFYINFPDPWPKKKHNKRRLLKPEFLKILKEKLVPGGKLFIVTDHDDYANEILLNLKTVEGLRPEFEGYYVNDLLDYYPTKYYRKFAVHNRVYFYRMVKV